VQNEKYLHLYFGQNQSPGIKLRNFAIPDILLAKLRAVTLHLGLAKSSAFGRFATEWARCELKARGFSNVPIRRTVRNAQGAWGR
jgi:hypothetical protein